MTKTLGQAIGDNHRIDKTGNCRCQNCGIRNENRDRIEIE